MMGTVYHMLPGMARESYAPYSAMLRFTIASSSSSTVAAFSVTRSAFFFNRSARALSLSAVRFLGIHTSTTLNAPGTIKPHLTS